MLKQFLDLKAIFVKEKIKATNNKLDALIYSYSFYHIAKESEMDNNQLLLENLKNSKVVIIKESTDKDAYFIVSFKKTIIFIEQFSNSFLDKLLQKAPHITIFNLPNEIAPNKQIKNNSIFLDEINLFINHLIFKKQKYQHFKKILMTIRKCIAGYLIKEGYANLRCNNEKNFFTHFEDDPIIEFSEYDFIEIRDLGTGSSFIVKLAYNIEREKLFAIKKPTGCSEEEAEKLIKRENNNYNEIKYFNIPKYYGKIKVYNYPVIEFIDGTKLENIEKLNLKNDEKMTIIK